MRASFLTHSDRGCCHKFSPAGVNKEKLNLFDTQCDVLLVHLKAWANTGWPKVCTKLSKKKPKKQVAGRTTMNLLQAIILGIIQGLTEFLPISSSGHLVLVPYFLGWNFPYEQVMPFDVLVQMGTLAAVIIYFWKDLWRIAVAFVSGLLKRQPFATYEARLGWFIILATIPAGLFGVTIKKFVEAAFNSPTATGAFYFLTAILLFAAERVGKRSRKMTDLTWKDALWIGCAQAISIFPGVSRSGSTMAGGISRDLDRPAAARFSFLMSIPVMLAAGLLETKDIIGLPNLGSFLPMILVGIVVAGIVGYLSIRWLISYISKHSLDIFAYYCVGIAVITLLFAWIR
jgi:undecaprenyl-diphosphatase